MSETQQNDTFDAQIAKETVARTLGQVGEQYNPYDDGPAMRYANIGQNAHGADVKRCLLVDSEGSDQLAYGWTNDMRTSWKIEQTGERVIVEDVSRLEVADNDDPVEDETKWVQGWIDILVDELRHDVAHGNTRRSVSDEIQFIGQRTLRLRDVDDRIAEFTFTLEE